MNAESKRSGWAMAGVSMVLAWASIAGAGTVDWTGTIGDWSTPGNWNPGVPGNGDDVTIGAGKTAILSSASMDLGSLDLTGTLLFTNWTTLLTATGVTIHSGGTMTHPPCNTNPVVSNTNRVNILCSNLNIHAGGNIDVTAKGYAAADGMAGQGPGGTAAGYRYGGAGHGSAGGAGKSSGGGPVYGSIAMPTDPGSAGGTVSGFGYVGGHGGGVVRILATGTVTVNGVIAADGSTGSGIWTMSGSGGSIYIACNTLEASTGSIHANGGYRAYVDCGGGGGGRIAIDYDPAAQSAVSPQPVLKIAASGREDYYAGRTPPGTLWLANDTVLPAAFDTNGVADVAICGVTSFGPSSLTVSNTWIRFWEPGISIAVGGDLKVTEAAGRFDVSNGAVAVADGLVVTNGAKLYVYGGDTNSSTPVHGALVQVTNDLIVGPSSWIHPCSHATNGLSPFFQCRSMLLAANGGFDATGTGYAAGPAASNGRGPGSTNYVSSYGQGAGYGGKGGRASTGEGGPTYGDPAAPVFPGSSGVSGQGVGGHGGGLVRIQAASNVTVHGSILANGNHSGLFGGGGSGGGVYIACNTFGGSPAGLVQANGGNGGYYANPGAYDSAGGGGRIAIVYDPAAQSNVPTPAVRFSANGAANFSHGHQGTVYFPDAGFFPYVTLDGGYTIVIPGFTNWAPDSLSITSGWVRFPDGFTFTVTNDVLVTGTDTWFIASNSTVLCGGNLVISNGGKVHIYSAATNGTVPDYGALVSVGQTLLIESNAVLYPYSHATNGGSALFRVGNLTVAAGGTIYADGTGFGVLPPGSGKGRGPGSGLGGVTFAAGSGYGGEGGDSSTHGGGPTYGSSNAPVDPGSSGVSGQNGQQSAGGGLVRVEAIDRVTVDGTITANGQPGAGQFMGGGSGGGIYLVCRRFGGSAGGRIRADGAKEGTDPRNGAGGGGRIAVWSETDDYAGTRSATGAVHQTYLTTPTRSGGDGTVVWVRIPPLGSLFVIH